MSIDYEVTRVYRKYKGLSVRLNVEVAIPKDEILAGDGEKLSKLNEVQQFYKGRSESKIPIRAFACPFEMLISDVFIHTSADEISNSVIYSLVVKGEIV